MSLRDDALPSKQSPVTRGDCFATCARNDMPRAWLASLRQLQSALSALLPSVLLPQGEAFKPLQDASQGELRC